MEKQYTEKPHTLTDEEAMVLILDMAFGENSNRLEEIMEEISQQEQSKTE